MGRDRIMADISSIAGCHSLQNYGNSGLIACKANTLSLSYEYMYMYALPTFLQIAVRLSSIASISWKGIGKEIW